MFEHGGDANSTTRIPRSRLYDYADMAGPEEGESTPSPGISSPDARSTAEVERRRREFAALLGEFRRTAVLVPVDEDDAPLTGDFGGVRWIYAGKLLERSESDDVTVRVIPFDLDGFARAASSMTYAGGPVPKLDTVVRDVPHGSAFIDSEAQLSAFRTRFRKVEAVSLDPDRSRDFIHKLAQEL